MQTSWDYQRLGQVCNKEGCILCRLTGEATRRYLETWKDELFTEISVREVLRRSKGFCHIHTWQLVQMGASLSLAQAYRDILSDEIELLEHGGESHQPHQPHRQHWFEPKHEPIRCPACTQKDQVLARLVSSLRQALPETAFYTQFSASDGLCLEHFHLACTLKPMDTSDTWLPLLRNAQRTCMTRLDEQLGELIRKHDYRYQHEPKGSEMVSWKRAAGLVAGEDERVY